MAKKTKCKKATFTIMYNKPTRKYCVVEFHGAMVAKSAECFDKHHEAISKKNKYMMIAENEYKKCLEKENK